MSFNMTLEEAKKEWINTNKDWRQNEEDNLRTDYMNNNYDLLTLCNVHKRSPLNITNKLKKMGLILAAPQVRGWETFKTTALYNELYADKIKNKEEQRPILKYDKIVKEMNEKEEDLKYMIKYYRENREQILRIKAYERELEILKSSIEYALTGTPSVSLTDIKRKEYEDICTRNFNEAFNKYNKYLSENETKNTVMLTVPMDVGHHELRYKFMNDSYKSKWTIDCDISTYVHNLDGKLIKELYTCRVNGTYSIFDGYKTFSTHEIIV